MKWIFKIIGLMKKLAKGNWQLAIRKDLPTASLYGSIPKKPLWQFSGYYPSG